jgi:hypothetical protein
LYNGASELDDDIKQSIEKAVEFYHTRFNKQKKNNPSIRFKDYATTKFKDDFFDKDQIVDNDFNLLGTKIKEYFDNYIDASYNTNGNPRVKSQSVDSYSLGYIPPNVSGNDSDRNTRCQGPSCGVMGGTRYRKHKRSTTRRMRRTRRSALRRTKTRRN